MAKPIITLNGLKIVIMLGMLVIILTGVRFAADIIVPFIWRFYRGDPQSTGAANGAAAHPACAGDKPAYQYYYRCDGAVSRLSGNLPERAGADATDIPLFRRPRCCKLNRLQRAGIEVSVEELLKYIDPNAAMTIVTSLLAQLSNAMTSIFLLFLTVVFMLLEVPQLPAKLQHIMVRPVEGMGAIQRALDSVSRYLVLKTAISPVTGLVVWGCSPRWMCVLPSSGAAGLCAQLYS